MFCTKESSHPRKDSQFLVSQLSDGAVGGRPSRWYNKVGGRLDQIVQIIKNWRFRLQLPFCEPKLFAFTTLTSSFFSFADRLNLVSSCIEQVIVFGIKVEYFLYHAVVMNRKNRFCWIHAGNKAREIVVPRPLQLIRCGTKRRSDHLDDDILEE